tara:strand:+ start:341 stop:532 length:192 start_codon:yes stop_codon:yes gene_type:complete
MSFLPLGDNLKVLKFDLHAKCSNGINSSSDCRSREAKEKNRTEEIIESLVKLNMIKILVLVML